MAKYTEDTKKDTDRHQHTPAQNPTPEVDRQGTQHYTLSQHRHLFTAFIDLTKAFDTICREGLWKIMAKYDIPVRIIAIVKSFLDGMLARVLDESHILICCHVIVKLTTDLYQTNETIHAQTCYHSDCAAYSTKHHVQLTIRECMDNKGNPHAASSTGACGATRSHSTVPQASTGTRPPRAATGSGTFL